MAKVAAKVYGDALFELAVEENRCDQFLEEICAVENALDQNPQAETLLCPPFELTAQQKSKIEKRLLDTTDYKKMEITYREDKTLIGGLVIRIGDRVIDTSIKSRLEELRLQLMGISLEA